MSASTRQPMDVQDPRRSGGPPPPPEAPPLNIGLIAGAGASCVVIFVSLLVLVVVWTGNNKIAMPGEGMTMPPSPGPAPQPQPQPQPNSLKNLVFMLSDGMGPIVVSAARNYKQWSKDPLYKEPKDRNGLNMGSQPYNNKDEHLTLDSIHTGSVQTRSLNSLITDSASGITAYSCAGLAPNRWVAKVPKDFNIEFKGKWQEDDGLPCKTLLEKAKEAGFRTGMVVTSRFTHATPAGFASHTVDREDENRIAWQMIERTQPDVIVGGGKRHLLKKGDPNSRRTDEWDGIEAAKSKGYTILDGFEQYKSYLAEGSGEGNSWTPKKKCEKVLYIPDVDHREYWIDQELNNLQSGQSVPGLAETARLAMRILQHCEDQAGVAKPFFMLMEASRIDHALHENDVAAAIKEVLEYDRAVRETILPIAEGSNTLVVGSSDHDTGGLSLGFGTTLTYPEESVVGYAYYPEVFAGQQGSILGRILASVQDGLKEGETLEERKNEVLHLVTSKIPLLTEREVQNVFEDHLMQAQFNPQKWDLSVDFTNVYKQIELWENHRCSTLEPEKQNDKAICRDGPKGTNFVSQVEKHEFVDWQSFKIAVGRMVANKAGVGVSTRGHSATDVNLYCFSPQGRTSCEDLGLSGNMPNWRVGKLMAEAVGLKGDFATLDIAQWNKENGNWKAAA